MSSDASRTARLLFAPELMQGTVDRAGLAAQPAVARAVHARPPGALPTRLAQALQARRGGLLYADAVVEPAMVARRTVLGERAAGPPRVLVRVDEFPHWEAVDAPRPYGTDAFRRFHDIMAGAGVPYLAAVVPRPARQPRDPHDQGTRPLDDREVAQLQRLAAEGVTFATHGLDHRTRSRRPRLASELLGRSPDALAARLDCASAALASHDVRPRVFVAPWNRFSPRQLRILAGRFDVVCGGPESVPLLGFGPTPAWRGEAVYLPSYPPFYAPAAQVLPAVEALAAREAALWVPVTLHWGWEADRGWEGLRRLARGLAGLAVGWDGFLAAVEASR